MTAAISLSACNGGPVYETSFEDNVLNSGEWTTGGSPTASSTAEYRDCEGVDSSGCIYLSSAERTHFYVSHQLTGLDTATLYRMSAKLRTKGVSEGRGAILSVKTQNSDQIWNASEFIYGDTPWKEVYIDFIPAADGTAEICCSLGNFGGTYNGGTASGEVWYDDVKVTKTTPEQIYFRTGRHVSIALDKDKVSISDSVADAWLANLDRIYDSYVDLVGDCPYDGRNIMVLTTPGMEAGYWALAGNPILWNNHTDICGNLAKIGNEGDWIFGILHEIGHTFSPGTVADNGRWNWNDELFANFRMSYALEACGGTVIMRDTKYTGAEIMDYYKIFYDETIGSGIAKNNGDALHYTFLRIKEKYGWDIFKTAFRELYAADPETMEDLRGDYEKMLFFLKYVSAAAGEDVTETCYTPQELKLIEQSLS